MSSTDDGIKTFYIDGTMTDEVGCSYSISRKAVSVKLVDYPTWVNRVDEVVTSEIGHTSLNHVYAQDEGYQKQSTYFDGLGRKIQVVDRQWSPQGYDRVQPITYDPLGRPSKVHLPFIASGQTTGSYQHGVTAQNGTYTGIAENFYNNPLDDIADDPFPFAQKQFEPSPLNRVTQIGNYGKNFQPGPGHGYYENTYWNWNQFVTNPSGGGGGVGATISGNTLTISFSAGFYSSTLLTGAIKKISNVITIPDSDLGTLAGGTYQASIQNGFITITAIGAPTAITGFAQTFTVDLSANIVRKYYQLNTENEVLRWWYDPATGLPETTEGFRSPYYASSKLYVNRTENQHGRVTLEYYDLEERLILTRQQAGSSAMPINDTNYASTYYVYDEVGNLAFVLPPESVKLLPTQYFDQPALTKQSFLDRWAFQYKHDGLKRLTEKRTPGVGAVYMVYDNQNRLILTQDANQRASTPKAWSFTKYDPFNRVVLTGIMDTTANLSQEGMQNVVKTFHAKEWTRHYETYTGPVTNSVHGYSVKAYPVRHDPQSYLTVSYYDSYDFRSGWYGAYNYVQENLLFNPGWAFESTPNTPSITVNGLLTGTKIRVLDGEINGNVWLKTANYFDEYNRPLQSVSDNYKSGIDRHTTLLTYNNRVRMNKVAHEVSSIQWGEITGAFVLGNSLKRNAPGTGFGTSGAVSQEQLEASTDGWIEIPVTDISTEKAIGLATANSNAGYTSIDYCFVQNGSTLQIVESGTVHHTYTNGLAHGDVLRIERNDGTITYKRNNVELWSHPVSEPALFVDVSLSTGDATVSGIRASFTSTSQGIVRTFHYDNPGRLTNTFYKPGSHDLLILSEHIYNEVGQLVDKKLHGGSGHTFAQSIDYRYDIRGWLTHINDSNLGSIDNDADEDLFGMEIGYNLDIGIGNSPAFNGNISGIKWSHNQGLADIKENAYLFTYDPMDRLNSANFKTRETSWVATANNGYAETGFAYDLNGNIKTLQRNDSRATGWMDNLEYDYGTGAAQSNILLKVNDMGDAAKGFLDGNTSGDDFTYDLNGNLTVDKNKGITGSSGNVIQYNHLNLPFSVQKAPDELVNFVYDATGRKLHQRTVDGEVIKTKDYVGDFLYENNQLLFVAHEEGRLIPGEEPEYQYFLKDHLENIRITFTTKTGIEASRATHETSQATDESREFISYNDVTIINSEIFDHTHNDTTSYAHRLNGSPNERYGLAKSLSVMPGDTIRAMVFAKYADSDKNNWTTAMQGVMTALAAAPLSPGSTGEGLVRPGAGRGTNPFSGIFLDKESDDNPAPKAYMNYLIFDRNDNLLDGGCVRLSEAAREYGQNGDHEELFKEIVIQEAGYVYLYLSNDNVATGGNMVDVFFDDFTVDVVKSCVIEQHDYYPFGLTFNSYQRELSVPNQYQFTGKEKHEVLGLGWIEHEARMYMPEIGRWNGTDPISEKFFPSSPYNYVVNHPTGLNDPSGADWLITVTRNKEGEISGVHFIFTGVIYNTSRYRDYDATKFENAVRRQIETVFNGEHDGVNVSIEVNLRTVKDVSEIALTDHIFEVVDPEHHVLSKGEIGRSPFHGLRIYINSDYVDATMNFSQDQDVSISNTKTVPHELGHNLGWRHPNDPSLSLGDKEFLSTTGDEAYNVMWQSGAGSRNKVNPNHLGSITRTQLTIAVENFERGRLNRQTNFSRQLKYIPTLPFGSNPFSRFILTYDRSKLKYPSR